MDNDSEDIKLDTTKKTEFLSSKVAIVSRGAHGQVNYTCVACSAQFNNKDKVQLHLLSHHNAYKFVCGVCGKGLKRREHLDRHMQEHSGKRPHICPDCGKGFKRKEHLNIHMTIHTGVKDLSCPVCKKKFSRKDHLAKHAQTHNRQFMEQSLIPMDDLEMMGIKTEVKHEYEEYTPIITDVIGNAHDNYDAAEMDNTFAGEYGQNQFQMSYDESYEMVRRLEGINTIEAPPYDQEFNERKEMINDPLRPHVCDLCGKSYKRKDHLKIHSWTHKKKEQMCKECGKAFHTQDQLLVHINLNHMRGRNTQSSAVLGHEETGNIINSNQEWQMANKQIGAHECNVCHRKFKRKQHLKVHYNVHMKHQSTAVWCSTCNEGFYNKTQYDNHPCLNAMESRDTSEDGDETQDDDLLDDARKENNPMELLEVVVNEYPDAEAVAEAEAEADVEALAEVDAEANIPEPRRVYLCKFCPKSFKRKDHYKIHQYIHTGVKTVFCPDCRKGFYRKDHLQKHMIVHARLKSKDQPPVKVKKHVPDLFPIERLPRGPQNNRAADARSLPEITIHAPSNTKLRVPLKIKVPYQMVMSMDNGETRAFTVDPQVANVSVSR